MRSKVALIVISLVAAAGTSLAACSSSGQPVPDEQAAETPVYEPVADSEYDEYEPPAEPDSDPQQDRSAQGGMGMQPEQPATGDPRAQNPTGQQPRAEGESDQPRPQPQPSGGEFEAPGGGAPAPGQPPMGQPPQQAQAELPEATGPVATVNGTEIPAEDFNEPVELLSDQAGQLPPQYVAQLQNELVEQLIQKQLLDEAVEDADIEVSDEEVDEQLQQMRAEFDQIAAQQPGQMSFEEYIAQSGMTMDELSEELEVMIAAEQLAEQRVDEPTDEDVRQFYSDNPEMFTEPEHVETRQLVLPVMTPDNETWEQAEQTTQQAHRQVTDEEMSFEDVATEHDQLQFQEAPVTRNAQFQPNEIVQAAFDDLEDDEISEPIRTDQGFVILERVEHHEEGMVDFEEIEDQLEAELRNQAMQESLQAFLTELEQDADIERHPENIE